MFARAVTMSRSANQTPMNTALGYASLALRKWQTPIFLRILPNAADSAGAEPSHLLGRELKDIPDKKIGVIPRVLLETRRQRSVEDKPRALLAEQTGGHGRPRVYQRRVEHPAAGPVRLQPGSHQEEVWSRRPLVVARIARVIKCLLVL